MLSLILKKIFACLCRMLKGKSIAPEVLVECCLRVKVYKVKDINGEHICAHCFIYVLITDIFADPSQKWMQAAAGLLSSSGEKASWRLQAKKDNLSQPELGPAMSLVFSQVEGIPKVCERLNESGLCVCKCDCSTSTFTHKHKHITIIPCSYRRG